MMSPRQALLYTLIHLPSDDNDGDVLRRSLRVGCFPGQENQGGAGAPRAPPRIVHNLDRGDVSTGDDDDDNADDVDLCGGREILCAVNAGTGLIMCPPTPTTGGLGCGRGSRSTVVPVGPRAARPLP